jgi:serine protease Do
VAETPVGTQITLSLDREGKKMDIPVTVQDRVVVYAEREDIAGIKENPEVAPKSATTPTSNAAPGSVKFGLLARTATEDEKELTPDKRGVTVTRVEPGMFAQDIRMQEKDIIIAINRQPVGTVDDIKRIQGALKPGDPVTFRIVRSAEMPTRGGAATRETATFFLTGTLPEN